jgi:hypothetical protein
MREAGMNEVMFGQWVNLGLVLESSEGMREDDAIIVLLERATGAFSRALVFAQG